MTPRRRRLYWVLAILAGVSLAGLLALRAFEQNVMFYFDPTTIAAGEVRTGQRFRLGGMVEKGSVMRTPGSLDVRFVVTDPEPDLYDRLEGVTDVEICGSGVTLISLDADATARDLVRSNIAFRDLEVTGACLEDAFIALTERKRGPDGAVAS